MNVEQRPATVRGPAEWFTGDVWIDSITTGQGSAQLNLGYVHFTPGARTAWHTHSEGQTLFVTEGVGRVQARGEPVLTIRPGDVVNIKADQEHWHGADPHHQMTHLSLSEGEPVWGDHVTDAEYDGG
jgi:quercetin dioxygenase-like cupin family protein